MEKIIIAVDGYSSTGKSTVARQLADYLNYIYVDSGAMYRAVALFALQNNFLSKDHFDKDLLLSSLPDIKIEFKKENTMDHANIYLNGKNVEKEIRTMYVSDFVSPIAKIGRAHV